MTGKAVVLFDGGCPFCRRSVALLKRLDWLGRLAVHDCRDVAGLPPCREPLVPARLLEEMHVVTPDGRHAPAGFRAIRYLAWRLPLTWPVAPVLHVPGMTPLGRRVYRRVARNRYGIVPCDAGGCRLHAPR